MSAASNIPVRRDLRLPLRTVVVVWSPAWQDMLALETVNVSRGGVFLRMAQPPSVGTPAVVRLRRADDWSDIAGVIVHAVARSIENMPAGFGVRFEQLDEEDLAAVEHLIDQANHAEPIFDPAVRGTREPLDPAIVQAELERLLGVAAQRGGGAITPISRGALLLDASQTKLQGAYHFARGEELRLRGRLEEACVSFVRALEIDPEHVDAIAALRWCWDERRRRQSAGLR